MGESAKKMKMILDEVKVFEGHPSRYENWHDLTLIAFESYYPLVHDLIFGKEKPPEVYAIRSTADRRTVAGGTPAQASATNVDGRVASNAARSPTGPPPGPPQGPPGTGRKETEEEMFARIQVETAAKVLAEKQQQEKDGTAAGVAEAKEPAEEDAGAAGAAETDDIEDAYAPPPTLASPADSYRSAAFSVLSDRQPTAMTLSNRSERDQWDKANSTLYNVLRLRTKGVAASLVKKHKPRPGTMGDGITVWRELKAKFQPDDEQYRRELMDALNDSTMKEGTDPETFFADVWDIVNKLANINVPIVEAHIAHVVLRGLPPSYDPLRLQADMDAANFNLKKIETTARNMYRSRTRDQYGRNRQDKGRNGARVRDSGMVATSLKPQGQNTCHSCGEVGHFKRNCPYRQHARGETSEPRGGRTNQVTKSRQFSRGRAAARKEAKWCQLHTTLITAMPSVVHKRLVARL